MKKLYHTQFKIGKRSFTEKNYFNNLEDCKSYYNAMYEAKIVEIFEFVSVYKSSSSKIPLDDPSTYNPTSYMMVASKDLKRSNRFILQTVKAKHSISDMLNLMKQYLGIDKNTSVNSLLSANTSSK